MRIMTAEPKKRLRTQIAGRLASVKFAVAVVVILAIACVAGTLLPQGADVAKFVQQNPAAAARFELFGQLGLTHIFDSLFRLLAAPAPSFTSLGAGLPPSRAVAASNSGAHHSAASAGEGPTSPSEPTDRSPAGNGETFPSFGAGLPTAPSASTARSPAPDLETFGQHAVRGRETLAQHVGSPSPAPADFRPQAYLYDIDDLETIVRENVRMREQELAVCHEIIEQKTAALMAKLNLDKERLYDLGLQSQPGWVPHGAAVCGG